jgi:hypothetical protein
MEPVQKNHFTSSSTIALNVLVINLDMLPDLLLVLFAYLLQLLLNNESAKSSRFVRLSNHVETA